MAGQTLQKAYVPLVGGTVAVYTASGLSYYRHPDWLGSSRLAVHAMKNALSKELSKTIADIDLLLNNPESEQEGPLREKFVSLRNHMEALRVELDTPLLQDPKLWEKW